MRRAAANVVAPRIVVCLFAACSSAPASVDAPTLSPAATATLAPTPTLTPAALYLRLAQRLEGRSEFRRIGGYAELRIENPR